MNAYVMIPAKMSRAMIRVVDALTRYAPPEVTIVDRQEDADLEVLHIIGHPDLVSEAARCNRAGKAYAVMQYCLRTTQCPNTVDWLLLWDGAVDVWSYYDIPALIHEDGNAMPTGLEDRFYLAPLGVDDFTFAHHNLPGDQPRRYTLLTSGYVADSECVEECTKAVGRISGRVFHLGPKLKCHRGLDHVDQRMGMDDEALADIYNSCEYVAGMRRVEGFEMPAAEGLLCGARPIMLDRPHYRRWFEPWAIFVSESDPMTLALEIESVLRQDARGPVTPAEREAARERFEWQPLVAEFWRRIIDRLTDESE